MRKIRRRVAVLVLVGVAGLAIFATRAVLQGRAVLRSLAASRLARDGDASRAAAVLERARAVDASARAVQEEPAGHALRTWLHDVRTATSSLPPLPPDAAAWLRSHDDELDALATAALAAQRIPVDPATDDAASVASSRALLLASTRLRPDDATRRLEAAWRLTDDAEPGPPAVLTALLRLDPPADAPAWAARLRAWDLPERSARAVEWECERRAAGLAERDAHLPWPAWMPTVVRQGLASVVSTHDLAFSGALARSAVGVARRLRALGACDDPRAVFDRPRGFFGHDAPSEGAFESLVDAAARARIDMALTSRALLARAGREGSGACASDAIREDRAGDAITLTWTGSVPQDTRWRAGEWLFDPEVPGPLTITVPAPHREAPVLASAP